MFRPKEALKGKKSVISISIFSFWLHGLNFIATRNIMSSLAFRHSPLCMNNSLFLKFEGGKDQHVWNRPSKIPCCTIKRVEIQTSKPRCDSVVIISNFFQHESV